MAINPILRLPLKKSKNKFYFLGMFMIFINHFFITLSLFHYALLILIILTINLQMKMFSFCIIYLSIIKEGYFINYRSNTRILGEIGGKTNLLLQNINSDITISSQQSPPPQNTFAYPQKPMTLLPKHPSLLSQPGSFHEASTLNFPHAFPISTQSISSLEKKGLLHDILFAFSAIFISGLGDKSFLITALMASKYNKFLIFFSSVTSLTIMGFLSIKMGKTLPNYIPSFYIDLFAAFVFVIFGSIIIGDGMRITSNAPNEHLENEIMGNQNSECNKNLTENSTREQIKIFLETFSLIFLAELGDKSQISIIYLSTNFNEGIIFFSVALANIFLTFGAIIAGKLIGEKITAKTISIISGLIFIVFGIVTAYLTFKHNYEQILEIWRGIIFNSQKSTSEVIHSNFLK